MEKREKMDRETLIRAILECNFAGYDSDIIDIAVKRIMESTGEPVRHGHWIRHHEPYTWMGYTYWSCSECNFECGYEKAIPNKMIYCPNCGAKMDGEK